MGDADVSDTISSREADLKHDEEGRIKLLQLNTPV